MSMYVNRRLNALLIVKEQSETCALMQIVWPSVPPAAPPGWTALGSNVTAGARGKNKSTSPTVILLTVFLQCGMSAITNDHQVHGKKASNWKVNSAQHWNTVQIFIACLFSSYQKPKAQLDLRGQLQLMSVQRCQRIVLVSVYYCHLGLQ